MATDKQKKTKPQTRPQAGQPRDPVHDAQEQAEKDIGNDPEFDEGDPDDDLDEGELARKDNSDEEGFDALEKTRKAGGHPGPHPGKGSEK
jgi:hypothetical protein